MGTTRITSTRNGASGLLYAGRQGKPHEVDEQGVIDRRVLGSVGVNIDPDYAQQQMSAVWRKYHTKEHNARELYRSTWSWSNEVLDPRNQEDIDKALKMGQEVAEKMWPGHQTAIYAQADGKGHKLHLHMVTNAVNATTGRALRAEQTDQKHLAEIADEVELAHGITPLPKVSKSWERKPHAQVAADNAGKYSWRTDLQQRIQEGLADPKAVNWDTLNDVLENHGVNVHIRRNKKTGDINGLSYALNFGDHRRPVRAAKLGEMYQKESVNNAIIENAAERDRQQLNTIKVHSVTGVDRVDAEIIPKYRPAQSQSADTNRKPKIHNVNSEGNSDELKRIAEYQQQLEQQRLQRANEIAEQVNRQKQRQQRIAQKKRDREERQRRDREDDGPSLG